MIPRLIKSPALPAGQQLINRDNTNSLFSANFFGFIGLISAQRNLRSPLLTLDQRMKGIAPKIGIKIME
jgi:hypothetical protein